MTERQKAYEDKVARCLDESWHLNAGDNETCEECPAEFTWSHCEVCGCPLGGERHCLIAIQYRTPRTSAILHLSGCSDCLVYIANGDLPEDEYLDWLA